MLKRFISYYKPHIGLLIIDMICAVIVAASGLFYPTIAKNIINEYVHDEVPTRLIYWSVILLAIYVLKAVCNYIIGHYGHVLGVRMQADMRRDLFMKYERLSFSYFDNHKTGDLITRISNDLFDVSELAHHGPENVFLSLLMLVGSFIILFDINKILALVMFSVVPFIVLFTVLSRRRMRRAMKSARRQMAEINTSLEISITGVRETKAFVAEHHEVCKFNKENNLFKKFRSAAMFHLGFYDAIMQLLSDILYLVVIFVGGLFLYHEMIDPGQFAAFMLYISMFLNPIQRFVSLFEQLQEGMSGYARFHEVMCEEEEEDNGKTELSDVRGEIKFDNVSFSYSTENDGKLVLSGLSLDIKAGKTLALVGSSGGGKTTVCNLIPRFYNVNSGRITLDGVDVRDISLKSLRSSIGMVSQNVFLFDGTVKENIAYGSFGATDEEIAEAAKRANIHDFILTMDKGYDTEVGERGVKLSGGQKQRIAIARVFLKNPKILILDEATSALDNATEMQIQESLSELSRGRTVIVVAHRLSTVKNADEIVVIESDGVKERGTHEQLLKMGGIYKGLYEYQFRAV